MRKTMALFVVGMMTIFVGCGADQKTAEVVQTVDWYKEHQAEREQVLAKGRSNPGEMESSPNYINANRAEQELTWSKRGGIKPPKPLKIEIRNN